MKAWFWLTMSVWFLNIVDCILTLWFGSELNPLWGGFNPERLAVGKWFMFIPLAFLYVFSHRFNLARYGLVLLLGAYLTIVATELFALTA